jgi:PAS domain S-box-containing protein
MAIWYGKVADSIDQYAENMGNGQPGSFEESSMQAPPEFLAFLSQNAGEIIEQWVHQVSRSAPNYRKRSLGELQGTISRSFEVNCQAMEQNSYAPLNPFVDFITALRLEAGFALAEVQKAFDMFRIIVMHRLAAQPAEPWLGQALMAVNRCVSYQIHRFSDKFQAMHNAAIERHARELECKVEERSRELRTSQLRYKTLVEEINDGYYAVVEGRIAFANRAFCQMHKAMPNQVLTKNFASFVTEEHRERVERAYQDVLAGRVVPRNLEYLRLALDGSKHPTEIRARVVDLGHGPMLIGICRDITFRVAMEKKVRENERMAYVGQLAASLSHEIRNPLSTINMNLQIMSRKPYLEPVDHERLDMAVSEVSRLEELLHQLLDLAKPLNPAPASMDLNALVGDCAKLLAPRLAKQGIRLRRRLDQSLPRIMADGGMLEQALINLLLNALEALTQGGHISVGTKAVDLAGRPGCELWVRDNGSGLGREELNEIFTPFFTKKRYGTGLGLTNVKRIAEAHGGTIAVSGSPGKGARFTLTLPVGS